MSRPRHLTVAQSVDPADFGPVDRAPDEIDMELGLAAWPPLAQDGQVDWFNVGQQICRRATEAEVLAAAVLWHEEETGTPFSDLTFRQGLLKRDEARDRILANRTRGAVHEAYRQAAATAREVA